MKIYLYIFTVFLLSAQLGRAANEFVLTNGGVVRNEAGAGETARAAAETLAGKLTEITGSPFTTTDKEVFSAIFLKLTKGPVTSLKRDGYTMAISAREGLIIEGRTELALQHAAWDLLHRVGYRQYFPGKTWEILPHQKTLKLSLNVSESPAYASRRIWYGYGFWDHNKEAWQDWVAKNRMEGGFALNTGHAYGRLIRSQQKTFDNHPEYYALVDGKRRIVPEAKLCISNPGVVEAAVKYGLEYFAENPGADSVSMDPSDGGNWCECEDCARMGPPNDRALTLANAVAEAIGKDRFVGMYAYGYHSPPPSIKVQPNVIISAATGFIKEGMTIDQIVSGWAEKGATIGIREYYSVSTWDRDLPGAARGSNLDYLSETIPRFHGMGARFLSAESSDNWGCNGLGYYFASRMMWSLAEANRREEIVDEFLENCFGPAKGAMGEFYGLIDGSNKRARLVYDDLLARMFGSLGKARTLAGNDEKILRRIDDLILYTRHAELYDEYRHASGKERQAAYEAMIRHAYRIRDTYMIHSYALFRDVHRRDKAISQPDEVSWKVPEKENSWKNGARYPESEIMAMLKDGLDRHSTVEIDFAAREYAESDLVPASKILALPEVPRGNCETGRGKRSWYTLVTSAPATLELQITGGLIKHYRDRGNVKVELIKIGGPSQTGEAVTLIQEDDSVPPDGVERTIKLTAAEPGLYRIDLADGSDMTRVIWPEGQIMTWKMSLEEFPASITGRWSLYFFVPEKTESIGLYSAAGGGQLISPDGKPVLDLEQDGGKFLSVPVPEKMDGKLWKISSAAGSVRLLNVPPFLARSPQEMILPADAKEF